jgi:DNA gyrase subunit A
VKDNNFNDLNELIEASLKINYKDSDEIDIAIVAATKYLEYSEEIIKYRAFPDLRDGLIPARRRLLYAMKLLNLSDKSGHKKSAKVTGDTSGSFHPHGDSIYDVLVGMSQYWANNLPLVDGQGNFGSIDGDSPAQQRYTEVRFSKYASLFFENIDKDVVDFIPNYDDTITEPSVLPVRYPNILINGFFGIGVGMSSSIVPFNPSEVMDALIYVTEQRKSRKEINVDDLLKIIPAPDLPTGGVIYNTSNMKDILTTGIGEFNLQAKYFVDELPRGKHKITITEIPFGVTKSSLIESIATLKRNEPSNSIMSGLTDLDDFSEKKDIEIVLEIKKDFDPDEIFRFIAKKTNMDIKLKSRMKVMDLNIETGDFRPRDYGIITILERFLDFRTTVLQRYYTYLIKDSNKKLHIINGILIALTNIDKVISIIKGSSSKQLAKDELINIFHIDSIQADSILNIRLSKLVSLEKEKLEEEHSILTKLIDSSNKILNSRVKQLNLLISDFIEVKEIIGRERKTDINEEISGNLSDLVTVISEENTIFLSNKGYIQKVLSKKAKNFSFKIDEDIDFLKKSFIADSLEPVLFITNKGRAFSIETHLLPTNIGYIGSLFEMDDDETIVFSDVLKEEKEIIIVSIDGYVKRVKLSSLVGSKRKTGIICSPSNLVFIDFVKDENLSLFTKDGKGIKFSVSEVPFLGRGAKGVRGIKTDSSIVFASLNDESVIYSKNGYFKYNNLKIQKRAGKGVIASFNKMNSVLCGVDFKEGFNLNVFFEDNSIESKELKLNSYLEKGTPLFKKSGVKNVYLNKLI